MAKTMMVGAPALTGKGARDLVGEFGKAKYPLKLIATNHMPRPLSLPAIKLFLGHVADAIARRAEVVFENEDALVRVVSDIGQIADLNGYRLAVTFEEVVVKEPAKKEGAEK